ncbi:MAG: hypothetical protein QXR19_15680 [Candidatus Jordarchaeaceae archaeon]
MRIIKLNSTRALKALETIRITKKPDSFISASIIVGEEQAKKFKETLGLGGEEAFPIFYKLRDSRYGIEGFKKEFPNAIYQPVNTKRCGEGYSHVIVELPPVIQIDKELLGFYDPMVSRGTTAVETISKVCENSQVDVLSSLHFFVAELGLNKLQLELERFFLKDYVIVLGMRGFKVDTSGYMGAILREQDYGDVMEGTYWMEYPPEKEQLLVKNGILKGVYQEVVMGYILYILLRYRSARFSNFQPVPKSLKELTTENWINAVLYYLQQLGAEVYVNDWGWKQIGARLAPTSITVLEALRQMEREWMIETEVEMRRGIKYKVYNITPWGDSYLRKIYLPVFDELNLLTKFTSKLNEVILHLFTRKLGDLLEELRTEKASRKRNLNKPN